MTSTAVRAEAPVARARLSRAVDIVLGLTLLLLAAPVILVLALLVRRESHGPVFRREPGLDGRGRRVELLSFRTTIDGATTAHHERLRAVVGAGDTAALTGMGRVLRATRAENLPRLVNIVAGHCSLR